MKKDTAKSEATPPRTPVETLHWVTNVFMQTIARLCAVNFFRSDCRPKLMTFVFVAGINSFFIFYVCMFFNKDMLSVLQCSACTNLSLQGMIKYSTLFVSGKSIRANIAIINEFYNRNTAIDSPNFKMLQTWSTYSFILSKTMMILLTTLGVAILLRPLATYLLFGEYEMILPIWLPGVDETTRSGYTMHTVYHSILTVLAIVGTIGADSLIIFFVLHMWPMFFIFANMFETINRAVLVESNRDSPALRRYIRNLIQIHKEICSYNTLTSRTYFYQCTAEVNTNGASLCACVFCILYANWIPAYFLFCMHFVKLFAYCFLGTVAEMASDKLTDTIVQSNWYLLPIREQKLIHLMLFQSQRPVILMAGFVKLNLNLFVDIMRTVYTVAKLLGESI